MDSEAYPGSWVILSWVHTVLKRAQGPSPSCAVFSGEEACLTVWKAVYFPVWTTRGSVLVCFQRRELHGRGHNKSTGVAAKTDPHWHYKRWSSGCPCTSNTAHPGTWQLLFCEAAHGPGNHKSLEIGFYCQTRLSTENMFAFTSCWLSSHWMTWGQQNKLRGLGQSFTFLTWNYLIEISRWWQRPQKWATAVVQWKLFEAGSRLWWKKFQ